MVGIRTPCVSLRFASSAGTCNRQRDLVTSPNYICDVIMTINRTIIIILHHEYYTPLYFFLPTCASQGPLCLLPSSRLYIDAGPGLLLTSGVAYAWVAASLRVTFVQTPRIARLEAPRTCQVATTCEPCVSTKGHHCSPLALPHPPYSTTAQLL